MLDAGDHVVLQRHGLDGYTPGHRVDHARNVAALAAVGCDRILAISSVGSLRLDLSVGTFLAPDDFIALDQPSTPVFDDERGHVVPGFDPAWRERVVSVWNSATGHPLVDGGVYWQSNGPRFETAAEVRYQAAHAHVVGMTMASECIAACELDVAYAAVCVVDNLGNGLGERPLTMEEFESGKRSNREQLLAALAAVVPELT